jgi:hypothetical protein
MARFVTSTIAVLLLASATAASGVPPKEDESAKVLKQALRAIALTVVEQSEVQEASAQPQAAPKQPDHDQGDDHASDVAILKVCNHDNPSAERSAICPQPNSPP